jgi:WD40 repeat protein
VQDEFSVYMLLEKQGAAAIAESEKRRELHAPKFSKHKDDQVHTKIMDCCSWIPPCGGSSARYATGARDGTIKLWECKVCCLRYNDGMMRDILSWPGGYFACVAHSSAVMSYVFTEENMSSVCDVQDLTLNRTIQNGNSWITAVKYMPSFKCLAVTSFSRSLTMYDITSPICTVCGSIPKMSFTPMAMDILPCQGDPSSQQVIIGDAGGHVHVHKLSPHASGDSFQVSYAALFSL